ncbi:hypothetical protein [Brevundimonas sp.]
MTFFGHRLLVLGRATRLTKGIDGPFLELGLTPNRTPDALG